MAKHRKPTSLRWNITHTIKNLPIYLRDLYRELDDILDRF